MQISQFLYLGSTEDRFMCVNEFLRTEMFSRNKKGELLILELRASRGDSFRQETPLSLSHCFPKTGVDCVTVSM